MCVATPANIRRGPRPTATRSKGPLCAADVAYGATRTWMPLGHRTPKRRQHAILRGRVQSTRISCQLSARPHDVHAIDKHGRGWIPTDPFNCHIIIDPNLRHAVLEQAPCRRRIRTPRANEQLHTHTSSLPHYARHRRQADPIHHCYTRETTSPCLGHRYDAIRVCASNDPRRQPESLGPAHALLGPRSDGGRPKDNLAIDLDIY